MGYVVRRLKADLREDFYRVHCSGNAADWCSCSAWWVPTWEGWGERSAEANRRVRDGLFERGEYDGYLMYEDKEPIGWCQAGPRDRLAKLVEQFELDPDPDTWGVTCFLIAPRYRRQGLAGKLLRAVLRDMSRRGVRRAEAYPRRGERLGELELWNGPESLFLANGFRPVAEVPPRVLLARDLPNEG